MAAKLEGRQGKGGTAESWLDGAPGSKTGGGGRGQTDDSQRAVPHKRAKAGAQPNLTLRRSVLRPEAQGLLARQGLSAVSQPTSPHQDKPGRREACAQARRSEGRDDGNATDGSAQQACNPQWRALLRHSRSTRPAPVPGAIPGVISVAACRG